MHDKKRLIRTSSKHMTYIPQNCYPYQQYSPFYPTTEQFLPEGVGTGMNMIYDIIYSLNVAPQKHPESLDLLYFLFKGISTYMYLF